MPVNTNKKKGSIIINKMFTYTPAMIRAVVDELDAILRDAVLKDTLERVFTEERNTMVCEFFSILLLGYD